MNGLAKRAWLPFTLSAAVGLIFGCSRTDASPPELGSYGERVAIEVGRVAFEEFRASRRAQERFAALYPVLHHRSTTAELLAHLAADPALASMSRKIRGVLDSEVRVNSDDAREVRARWDQARVQAAIVGVIAGAALRSLHTVSPTYAATLELPRAVAR